MNISVVYYFISEDVLMEYRRDIAAVMGAIVVFGIASNLVNVIAFVKMGLADSISISFLALSLSDLCHLLISWVQVICLALLSFNNFAMGGSIFLILYWYAYMFYDASTFITTYIAVAPCCCVAMPLRFKNVLTRSRTTAAMLALVVTGVALRLPIVASMQLVWVVSPVTNASVLIVRITGDVNLANRFNDTVNRNAIPLLCFVVVAVCMFTLGAKLYGASKFRQNAYTVSKYLQNTRSGETTKSSFSLSAKDIKVIESVALVSAMFVTFNLPFILYSLTRIVYPPFSTDGPYSRLFTVVATLSQVWGYLGVSVNAFIYYKYNSRYKQAVQSLVGVVYAKI